MLPTTIGPYKVEDLLGSGGMADVYLAHDWHGQPVAVKVPRLDGEDREELLRRFHREAKAVAVLRHEAIVRVLVHGDDNGHPYIVMRYLSCGSLVDQIEQGVYTLAEALPIIERIAAALDYAHSKNVIHRDVKPGNVLFDDEGHAYLSDFGIAHYVPIGGESTVDHISVDGRMRGTIIYMSPEQLTGQRVTGQTDIYSLALVIHEMLTGRPRPDWGGDEADADSRAVQVNQPAPLPPPVQTVLYRALKMDPDKRHPSAAALAAELRTAAKLLPPQSAPLWEPKTAPRPVARAKPGTEPVPTPASELEPEPISEPEPEPGLWSSLGCGGFLLTLLALTLMVLVPLIVARRQAAVSVTPTAATTTTPAVSPPTTLGAVVVSSTHAPTLTPTPTPTLTPTPPPRPTRPPRAVIVPENAARVEQAAMWRIEDSTALLYSPDGRALAVASSGGVQLLDAVTLAPFAVLGPEQWAQSVAFSPDGRALAVATRDRVVRIWNVLDGALLAEHDWNRFANGGWGIAFSPDGRLLAAGDTIWLWQEDVIERVGRSSLNARLLSVAFSPDGRTLATGWSDHSVDLHYLTDYSQFMELSGHTNWVRDVAFSPDGSLLASGADDGTIRLWRAVDGAPVRTLALPALLDMPGNVSGGARHIAFSPDGRILAVTMQDLSIRLWDVAGGSQLATLRAESTGMFLDVAFAPDGRTLATTSDDGWVRLWGIPAAEEAAS